MNAPILVLCWNIYFELWAKFLAFLSAFITNLEHVFVYQFSWIDLNTLFPEMEYVFVFEALK